MGLNSGRLELKKKKKKPQRIGISADFWFCVCRVFLFVCFVLFFVLFFFFFFGGG